MQYLLAHIFRGEIKNDNIKYGILAVHSIKLNFCYFKVAITQNQLTLRCGNLVLEV